MTTTARGLLRLCKRAIGPQEVVFFAARGAGPRWISRVFSKIGKMGKT